MHFIVEKDFVKIIIFDKEAGIIKFNVKDNVIDIYSTVVHSEFQGQKLGEKLVLKVIEHAKENDFKIKSSCSYVTRFFEKNAEYQNLLK